MSGFSRRHAFQVSTPFLSIVPQRSIRAVLFCGRKHEEDRRAIGGTMQSAQTRRRLLATLSCTMAASAFGGARISAQDAPPETTTIRLAKIPGICVAPQYIAEELLRIEGPQADSRTVCAGSGRVHHAIDSAGLSFISIVLSLFSWECSWESSPFILRR